MRRSRTRPEIFALSGCFISAFYHLTYEHVRPTFWPGAARGPGHADARHLRAARLQRGDRHARRRVRGDGLPVWLAVDHRGDPELREALGGAWHLARLALL